MRKYGLWDEGDGIFRLRVLHYKHSLAADFRFDHHPTESELAIAIIACRKELRRYVKMQENASHKGDRLAELSSNRKIKQTHSGTDTVQ
jgi:hypothetical protein